MPTQLDEQLVRLSSGPVLRGEPDLFRPVARSPVPPVAHAKCRVAHGLVEPFIGGRLRRRRQDRQGPATTFPRESTNVGDTAIHLDEGRSLRGHNDAHGASVGRRTETWKPQAA
jgi:hypothetical protein